MRESSSFDFITITNELRKLVGSKVEKIYNPFEKEFLFALYHPEIKKKDLRIIVPEVLYVTEQLFPNPTYPSHFCMFLRKHLSGAVMSKLVQKGFERIIEIHFIKKGKGYILVCEFFSKGNMILCDDEYKIIAPLKVQDWSSRSIRPKREYGFPPSNNVIDERSLNSVLIHSQKKDVVRALAIDVGLGGKYAEELCFRAKVDKSTPPKQLSALELSNISTNFFDMIKQLRNSPEPNIVLGAGKYVDVVPLQLNVYAESQKKVFPSFNQALNEFYVKERKKQVSEGVVQVSAGELERLEQVLESQGGQLKSFEARSEEAFAKGKALQTNFSLVERIVGSLLDARQQGYSWEEVVQRLDTEKDGGNYEAGIVDKIRYDEGVMELLLDGQVIDFDFTQSVAENVDLLFEEAKKNKSKAEGARTAMMDSQSKIVSAKARKVLVKKSEDEKAEVPLEKKWFESFRWFHTSEGFLCISGRDAGQNENLIRKHLEVKDMVLHADTDQDFEQASVQTASYSSAWKAGRSVDVYLVKPEQVTKHAPSGEYVSRGGFMIKGKKKYFHNVSPRIAIGFAKGRIIAGPVEAIRRQAKHFLSIVPGSDKSSMVAGKIKEYFLKKGFNVRIEEIQKVMPAGGASIKMRYSREY